MKNKTKHYLNELIQALLESMSDGGIAIQLVAHFDFPNYAFVFEWKTKQTQFEQNCLNKKTKNKLN